MSKKSFKQVEPLTWDIQVDGSLNTTKHETQIGENEASDRRNLRPIPGGLETRPGTTKYTTQALPALVKSIGFLGTTAVGVANSTLYQIGTTNVKVCDSANTTPQLLEFKDRLVIVDGGRLREWLGPKDNLLDTPTACAGKTIQYQSLYTGANTIVGQRWIPAYSLDHQPHRIDGVRIYLKKTGAPTGDVTISIYCGYANYALKNLVIQAADLTTSGAWYNLQWTNGFEVYPGFSYIVTVAFGGGSSAAYVETGYYADPDGEGDFTLYASPTWTDYPSRSLAVEIYPDWRDGYSRTRMLRDDGDLGYIVNNLNRIPANYVPMWEGNNIGVGQRFTMQDWGANDAHHVLNITKIGAYLSKVGEPGGKVWAEIICNYSKHIMRTSRTVEAGALETIYTEQEFIFDDPYPVSPGHTYIFAIRYADGNRGAYVRAWTIPGTGEGWLMRLNQGTWNNDRGADLSCRVAPGLPPIASRIVAANKRLVAVGDTTAGQEGFVWVSEIDDENDWSDAATPRYVDCDSAAGGELTGIEEWYGDVFCTKTTIPGVYRIKAGFYSDYSDWTKGLVFKGITTIAAPCIRNVGNDIFMLDKSGLLSLSMTEQAMDVTQSNISKDFVQNILDDYAGSAAYAIYCPELGEYWIDIGRNYFLVISASGKKWTAYSFAFTHTCFASNGGRTYVGASNGHVYYLDNTVSKDDGVSFPDTYHQSKIFADTQKHALEMKWFSPFAASRLGATMVTGFYKDQSAGSFLTKTDTLRTENLTLDECDMSLTDAIFSLDPAAVTGVYRSSRIKFRCHALQFKVDFSSYSRAVRLQKLALEGARLGVY